MHGWFAQPLGQAAAASLRDALPSKPLQRLCAQLIAVEVVKLDKGNCAFMNIESGF